LCLFGFGGGSSPQVKRGRKGTEKVSVMALLAGKKREWATGFSPLPIRVSDAKKTLPIQTCKPGSVFPPVGLSRPAKWLIIYLGCRLPEHLVRPTRVGVVPFGTLATSSRASDAYLVFQPLRVALPHWSPTGR